MRKLMAVICLYSAFWLTPAQAEVEHKPAASIVSAMPVLHALNQALLAETGVEVIYLPPRRLPVSRIGHWLQHKSGKSIAELAPVTALTTIESVWPEQGLLKHLRVNNVAVIQLDAATELLNGGARISLSREDIEARTAFWMAPDNLLVMSQILARDMQRIWPEHAAVISRNQRALQHQLRTYALQLDQWLIAQDRTEVCLLSPELMPLARATNLPVSLAGCAPQALKLQQGGKQGVAEPDLWQVDALQKPIKGDLSQWLNSNLDRLKQTQLK